MTNPQISIETKNVYGRLVAYPRDTFTTKLLELTKEKCFLPAQVMKIAEICDMLGADLNIIQNLKGKDLEKWNEKIGLTVSSNPLT